MECKKTRDVCRELEALGALCYPVVAGDFAPPGWPDRVVWHRRWQGFIEFKDLTTTLKPIQAARIAAINARAPGTAYVGRFTRNGITLEDEHGTPLALCKTAKELLDTLEVLHAGAQPKEV